VRGAAGWLLPPLPLLLLPPLLLPSLLLLLPPLPLLLPPPPPLLLLPPGSWQGSAWRRAGTALQSGMAHACRSRSRSGQGQRWPRPWRRRPP
jgi:hypothetical protein